MQMIYPVKNLNLAKCFTLIILGLIIACSPKIVAPSIDAATGQSFDISTQSRIVEIDNLGKVFVVDNKNVLTNYKPDNTKLFEYANKRTGSISTLDVSNPLKILAFYDDFNRIKFLDNTLSEIQDIDLNSSYQDVSAAGMANDGNIWIYDAVRFRLVKINENGNKILESSNVNDFGISGVKISSIRDKGNYVVMVDPAKGFYIFDNLGQYVSRYEVREGMLSFQFDGMQIMYYTTTGLKSYVIHLKERQIISTPLTSNLSTLKYYLYTPNAYLEVRSQGLIWHSKK
jgi:hypothetical protein